jgi:hypothetical protein
MYSSFMLTAGLLLAAGAPPDAADTAKPAGRPPEGAIGCWKVPEAQVRAEQERMRRLNAKAGDGGAPVVFVLAPEPFRCHGDTVTLWLMTRKAWQHRSADDYYRVKARWQGNDLYILYPYGRWEKFATFADGKFREANGDGPPWVFEKVRPTPPLSRVREPYDYRRHYQPSPWPEQRREAGRGTGP